MSLLDPPEFDRFERYDPPNPEDNAFDERPDKRDPDYYCLGRGKWHDNSPHAGKYKYCYARAGAGTNHTGYGRCQHHGGANPAVENRYEALLNPSISEKIGKFLNDPNPLDLKAELAAARAIFEDTVERHGEFTEALLAWHASFDPKRRGLHDKPLYHFDAFRNAYKSLAHDRLHEATDEELHEALEAGLKKAQEDWRDSMIAADKEWALDLKVEKPMKTVDISHAARVLKIVSDLVTAIIKHEREAFLSLFAVQQLIETYGQQTRKVLARHLRRLGVNDGEAVNTIIVDISKEWERAPVVENSVPRLAAERQQQDKFLGS